MLHFGIPILIFKKISKNWVVDHLLVSKNMPILSQNTVVEIHLFSKGRIDVLILPLKSVWSANLILYDKSVPNMKYGI